ncbi:unnamed protein product [Cylindrotheca closterium]|uniref:Uncharacterized protein n=1 Tax=Cylindrotheca closterium TaxID=2856 RepID=A0AAD2CK04_9STRA|nr:unnamed protein product [Cylindrotheca closterium]
MPPAKPDPPKLSLTAVRQRSLSVPGCRELPSTNPTTILSFVVGLDEQDSKQLARINVFLQSGTIGTSRVLNGTVRQTFRRNVTSLDTVGRLLRHPEKLVEIDNALVSFDDNKNATVHQQQQSLKKQAELAEVGHCILQVEKEKLEKHLSDLMVAAHDNNINTDKKNAFAKQKPQQPQQKNKEPPAPTKPVKRNAHSNNETDDDSDDGSHSSGESSLDGLEFQFSLPEDVMTQVDQCLRDIQKLDKIVTGVATNGEGTVFLYGNGGVAYTPSIPKALYQKLRNLRNTNLKARPSYIAVGTKNRYFVAFHDGTADWKAPKALDRILKKCISDQKMPRSVSFGKTFDTFFVVFHDGSWQYQGRGIPESLEEKLEERDCRADLMTVNLGPEGEWFLKAKNGRMWWNEISEELDGEINDILDSGKYLHNMDFGDGGSFFLSFHE